MAYLICSLLQLAEIFSVADCKVICDGCNGYTEVSTIGINGDRKSLHFGSRESGLLGRRPDSGTMPCPPVLQSPTHSEHWGCSTFSALAVLLHFCLLHPPAFTSDLTDSSVLPAGWLTEEERRRQCPESSRHPQTLKQLSSSSDTSSHPRRQKVQILPHDTCIQVAESKAW